MARALALIVGCGELEDCAVSRVVAVRRHNRKRALKRTIGMNGISADKETIVQGAGQAGLSREERRFLCR